MRAYILQRHGKPSVLKIQETPVPVPKNNQVRVKIETIGINYAEILSRKGLYGWAPKMPYIPGMEAYGKIDAVGESVHHRNEGENVIVGDQNGSYAEYLVVDEKHALPAIPIYSPEENAAFAVNYMTAWITLFELARLQPGECLLVHAAAGGVGTAAVQLAKKYGCIVYGTTSNPHKMDILKSLQVDAVIDYAETDFTDKIMEITDGEGVDAILELVGGDVYKKSLKLIRPMGRVVVAGFASLNYRKWDPFSLWKAWRAIPRVKITHLAEHSYGVLASHLGHFLEKDPKRMREIFNNLMDFVVKNDIHPIINKVVRFEEIAAAHQFIESRQSFGKIVAKI